MFEEISPLPEKHVRQSEYADPKHVLQPSKQLTEVEVLSFAAWIIFREIIAKNKYLMVIMILLFHDYLSILLSAKYPS